MLKFLPIISSVSQACAIFCFSTIVVIAIILSDGRAVNFSTLTYLWAAGFTFASSITSSRKSGVDFLITFYFLFMVAIPSYVQVSARIFPWFANLDPRHLTLTYGLLSVCQLSYIIGQSLSLRLPITTIRTPNLKSNLGSFYTKWAWGIFGFAFLCAMVAGPGNLTVARFERDAVSSAGLTQQFLFMARSSSLLALILLIYLARHLPPGRLKGHNIRVLAIAIPAFLIINYPPALPRFVLFGTLIAISCCYVNYRNPNVKIVVSVLAALFLFWVFPFTKQLAHADFNMTSFFNSIGALNLSAYMLRVDFDGFMQIVSTVQYLDDGIGGIRWGNNFLGVLLFFVPRGVWPSKPIDTGEIVSTSLGYWYNNVASPLPAEALMAFGLIGPIVVFAILGFIVSRVELTVGSQKNGTANISRFALYSILMGFIIIILRGALNGVAPQFASGFLIFAIMMTARRNRIVWKK